MRSCTFNYCVFSKVEFHLPSLGDNLDHIVVEKVSTSNLITLYNRQSSASSPNVEGTLSAILLTCIKNIRGPKTVP